MSSSGPKLASEDFSKYLTLLVVVCEDYMECGGASANKGAPDNKWTDRILILKPSDLFLFELTITEYRWANSAEKSAILWKPLGIRH